MKKVLCISESCCDLIFCGLPRIPTLGEEIYGDSFTIKAGGGANTPISLAYLGVDTSYLTRIGTDELGEYVSRALVDAGVSLVGKSVQPEIRTAVSAVLSTDTDRCFASYVKPGQRFTMEEIEEAVQSCDIVHTYLWYARLYHLADVCEKYGKELSLDASFGETLDESARAAILGKCHWVKMNEVEACQVTGLASAEEALICLHKDVQCGIVVTLGAKGSIGMLHGDDRIIRIAPQNLGEFRDACGAGDAYSAGMLYGLAKGYDLEKAMAIGSYTSGLAVTWPGGTDAAMRQLRDKF